ncbi:MAG: restriction endonuclease subunit S [Actinomycetia bacterium]|nr:restriction endonuclease subunit S [Actinomycetes bacterium]
MSIEISALPLTWMTRRLGEIALEIQPGFASGDHNARGDGVIHVRPMNISRTGQLVFGEVKYVKDKSSRRLHEGDVVFNNTNSPALVGKTAVLLTEQEIAFSNHMTRVRVDQEVIDPRFLAAQLHGMWMNGYFEEICSNHVNQASVSTRRLADVKVVVPPLAEQQQVIGLLEETVSRLDLAVASLRMARAKADLLTASVLWSATGSLSGDSTTLGAAAKWFSGGTPRTGTPGYYGGEIPWAVIGDLTEGAVVTTAKTITPAGLKGSSAKVVEPGTVLLAMYGASIGRTGIASVRMATNQAIACAKVNPNEVRPEFLLRFLQAQKPAFVRAGQGGAQPNISQTIIKAWPFTLPSLAEQDEAVAMIDESLTRLSISIAGIDRAEHLAAAERRALFNSAFAGKLTTSWRRTHHG